MIIDLLPNQYEAIAARCHFYPWQTGLLGNMLTKGDSRISINMGRRAGHTYFTRVVASSDFPLRTKVYLTRQEALPEYADLVIDEGKVHEPIELLSENNLLPPKIKFVLVDMNSETARRFKEPLRKLDAQLSRDVRLIILQANFSLF